MKHIILVTKTFTEKAMLDSIAEDFRKKNISFGIYKNESGYYIRRKAYPDDIEKAQMQRNFGKAYFKESWGTEKLIEEFKGER